MLRTLKTLVDKYRTNKQCEINESILFHAGIKFFHNLHPDFFLIHNITRTLKINRLVDKYRIVGMVRN